MVLAEGACVGEGTTSPLSAPPLIKANPTSTTASRAKVTNPAPPSQFQGISMLRGKTLCLRGSLSTCDSVCSAMTGVGGERVRLSAFGLRKTLSDLSAAAETLRLSSSSRRSSASRAATANPLSLPCNIQSKSCTAPSRTSAKGLPIARCVAAGNSAGLATACGFRAIMIRPSTLCAHFCGVCVE